jgi:endonuclease III
LKKSRIKEIISRLEEYSGSRTSKRKKINLLDLLIATKLSQNTTDKTSYIAFKNLKNKFRNWDEVSSASLPEIRSEIKVCGLADKKSADIRNMLREMKENYGKLSLEHLRKYDDDKVYEELLQYKGIGTKTVSCVLAFGMDRPVFPVDTHVHRILNRLGIVDTKAPDDTFAKTKILIPDDKKIAFHTNLIKFGRSVCKAPKPLCSECVIFDLCGFKDKKYYCEFNAGKVKKNDFIILENL